MLRFTASIFSFIFLSPLKWIVLFIWPVSAERKLDWVKCILQRDWPETSCVRSNSRFNKMFLELCIMVLWLSTTWEVTLMLIDFLFNYIVVSKSRWNSVSRWFKEACCSEGIAIFSSFVLLSEVVGFLNLQFENFCEFVHSEWAVSLTWPIRNNCADLRRFNFKNISRFRILYKTFIEFLTSKTFQEHLKWQFKFYLFQSFELIFRTFRNLPKFAENWFG
jgi:hypothetical protein